jgi:hypothetical protein
MSDVIDNLQEQNARILKRIPKKLSLEILGQFEKYPGGIKCV